MSQATINSYLGKVRQPDAYSHKGQNGKVLVIGGSDFFHAASRWCLDTASRLVDMVFYCSVPGSNQLITEAKGEFWNGIVIERTSIESYIEEADSIVIGPGMERTGELIIGGQTEDHLRSLSEEEWQGNSARITNYLLAKYPHKKWVVDAGALQMVDPWLLTNTTIITPHHAEYDRIEGVLKHRKEIESVLDWLTGRGVTVLLKGPTDYIYCDSEVIEINGGNAGMTKGGTGDVLAGLVAGLYATNNAATAAIVGSYVNKTAGEVLWQKVGAFYNATDLAEQIPQTLKNVLSI